MIDDIPQKEDVEFLQRYLRGYSNEVSGEIIEVLRHKPFSVNDLALKIKRTQSSTSNALRGLLSLQLVKCRRKGKFTIYSIDTDMIRRLEKMIIMSRSHLNRGLK